MKSFQTTVCFPYAEHLIYQSCTLPISSERRRNGFPQPSSITSKNGQRVEPFVRFVDRNIDHKLEHTFESRAGTRLILTRDLVSVVVAISPIP